MRARLRAAGVALAAGSWLSALPYASPAAGVEPLPLGATCTPRASADVDRGAALLVALAFDEARQAFERAGRADRDCALAHWGQAVSRLPSAADPLTVAAIEAGVAAARRAANAPARTDVERALVASVAALFTPPRPTPVGSRLEAYETSLGALARSRPDLGALAILHARAALLRTTLPGDAPRGRAVRAIDEAFRNRPLPLGAAVALLEGSEGLASSAVARRAADAIARVPLPAPHHLALRALVAAGEWDAAARAGEAAMTHAGAAVSPTLLYGRHASYASEWLVEAYLQQGRHQDARLLLTKLQAALARARPGDAAAGRALRHGLARAAARVALDARSKDLAGLPGRPADGSTAGLWPWRFAEGFAVAWHAWPGGDPGRLDEARQRLDTLARDAGGEDDPELDLARTLLEGTMAASQDEHPSVTLFMAHATEREAQLQQTGRLSLPLLPAHEVAAEIWLRFYRYADAEREARAALDRSPNRWRAWLAIARATAALRRPDDARAAYRRVAEIRARADAGDAALQEAHRAVQQTSGAEADLASQPHRKGNLP